jgi:hypothetical protein
MSNETNEQKLVKALRLAKHYGDAKNYGASAGWWKHALLSANAIVYECMGEYDFNLRESLNADANAKMKDPGAQ